MLEEGMPEGIRNFDPLFWIQNEDLLQKIRKFFHLYQIRHVLRRHKTKTHLLEIVTFCFVLQDAFQNLFVRSVVSNLLYDLLFCDQISRQIFEENVCLIFFEMLVEKLTPFEEFFRWETFVVLSHNQPHI